MVIAGDTAGRPLLRRGFALEYATLGWNVARHRGAGHRGHLSPVGGAGRLGLDSPIEIGASVVVIWELSGTGLRRQRRALRLIGSVVTGTPLPRRVQLSRPRDGSLSVLRVAEPQCAQAAL